MEAMCFAETAMVFVSEFKHAQDMGGYFTYIRQMLVLDIADHSLCEEPL